MAKTMAGETELRAAGAAAQRVVERRAEPRYPAPSVGFRSHQIQASLVDLSHDGLAIESLEHPPIGGTLIFALERGKTRADADGEVCWCNLNRTYRTVGGDIVAVYRAGIRLGNRRPPVLASITRAARLDWTAGSS